MWEGVAADTSTRLFLAARLLLDAAIDRCPFMPFCIAKVAKVVVAVPSKRGLLM